MNIICIWYARVFRACSSRCMQVWSRATCLLQHSMVKAWRINFPKPAAPSHMYLLLPEWRQTLVIERSRRDHNLYQTIELHAQPYRWPFTRPFSSALLSDRIASSPSCLLLQKGYERDMRSREHNRNTGGNSDHRSLGLSNYRWCEIYRYNARVYG